MKLCRKCNTEKPYEQFSRDRKAKDGYRAQCKQCRKQWDIDNRELYIEMYTKNNIKNKARIRESVDREYQTTTLNVFIVYQLPNADNYVGQTNNPTYRMRRHKTEGRDTTGWIELHRFNNREEALAKEAEYHDLGYPGKYIKSRISGYNIMNMEKNNKLRRKKKLYKMIAKEDGGVNAISLVLTPAIMKEFVALSRQPQKRVNLQEDKRILVSPVLIPDIEIPRFDEETGEEYDITFGVEEIAKIAENFLINGYQNEATLEHDEEIEGVSVIESWIKEGEHDKSIDFGFGDLPIGTWFVKMRIHDNELWAKIKSGEVRGLSIEGMFGHELVENAMIKMRAQNEEVKAQNVLNAIRDIINEDIDEAMDAEVLLAMMKGVIKNDGRVRGGKKLELESYSDYPSGVVNNAKKAVDFAEEYGWGKCLTAVGKIRASQLSQKKPISVDTIKRMRAYLIRHEVDLESSSGNLLEDKKKGLCGLLAYYSWGGKAGLAWSTKKLKELGVLELSNEEIYGKRYINLYETEPNFTNNYTTPAMGKPTYFDLGLEDACWEGYVAIGTKMLDGREVPNCVPEEKLMALAKAMMELGEVELETAVGIASSYAGQFGSGKKQPSEADILKKRNKDGKLMEMGGYIDTTPTSDEMSKRFKSF